VIRHLLLVCAFVGIAAGQEDGAVKVTVARANVRTEASEKAPVLTQVTLGTVLTLKRVDGDWDLGKELKQDVVRAEAEPDGRGGIKLRPSSALAPGEYALVLRPSRKKLPGATVLASTAEGRLFGLVWDFTVK
jgi:hypothetical protein